MSDKIVGYVEERISEWETGMSPFFGYWNEWTADYEMKFVDKDPRPEGISKNVVAETPRAVNTVATTITRMQTANDPSFELRAMPGRPVSEEQIFAMESRIQEGLNEMEFKRYLLKGNRSMCLFGTQVWEKPLIRSNFGLEGTALRPLSLLQAAFNPSVYDMAQSDHLSPVIKIGEHSLRTLANSPDGIWDQALIEKAIEEGSANSGESGFSKSSIEQRRQRAGYQELKEKQHELILFNGRLPKYILDTEEFQKMWFEEYKRTDDPRLSDITIGVLDRKYRVRFHPTPYGTWHHMYDIGHYIEFELEPMGYGIGAFGHTVQKDINRLMRNISNVSKFSLFNMMLSGRGSGLKSNNMNVFPFSAIQVDDINQIKPLQPQVESMNYGLQLMAKQIEDFRAVTHATSTLQAVITGATATESSLAQESSLRALSLCAEVNSDSVIRPYYRTYIRNMIDQNPYDANLVPVEVVPKLTTDKDYKPEYSKKLLEFLNLTTTIRNVMPIDFNPMPILQYFARSVGINPRELAAPKSQADRILEVMRRLSNSGGGQDAVAGERAGAGAPDGNVSDVQGAVPTSPMGGMQ